MNDSAVIITAGGSGLRMNSSVKKQYLLLNGKPVLYYPLNFFNNLQFRRKILVVPEEDILFVKNDIIDKFGFYEFIITKGGATRHHSVYNGLKNVVNCKNVLIHDGVRPVISKKIIDDLYVKLREQNCNGVIPVIQLKDTIKKIQDDYVIETINRSELRAVQTPQAFKYDVIMKCYENNFQRLADFTDDAAILEISGYKVNIIDGDFRNIKITTSDDFQIAELFLHQTV